MSTVLKAIFLVFVCAIAIELQAYTTSVFGPSQATEAALHNFNGPSADHGTWVQACMRFWAGNAGIFVMWLALLTFAVVMFWTEITNLARFLTEKKE